MLLAQLNQRAPNSTSVPVSIKFFLPPSEENEKEDSRTFVIPSFPSFHPESIYIQSTKKTVFSTHSSLPVSHLSGLVLDLKLRSHRAIKSDSLSLLSLVPLLIGYTTRGIVKKRRQPILPLLLSSSFPFLAVKTLWTRNGSRRGFFTRWKSYFSDHTRTTHKVGHTLREGEKRFAGNDRWKPFVVSSAIFQSPRATCILNVTRVPLRRVS